MTVSGESVVENMLNLPELKLLGQFQSKFFNFLNCVCSFKIVRNFAKFCTIDDSLV